MQAHPLADAFPLLEGEEFDKLVADIEANGLLHPVVRHEGMILDGRNRFNACQRLGIPHREVEFRGDDPVAFVVSENLARRHMTPAQLAIAAEKLATAAQGRPRTKGPDGTEEAPHETTIAEATKLTGASGTAVKRVRKVRREAEPEVVAAMDAGQLTPTAAEALTSLPAEEQRKAVAEGAKAATAKGNQVQRAQRAGTVSKRTDPKVVMGRQMNLPDLRMVQDVAEDWSKRSELIHELDPEKVTEFLKVLRASRVATDRLIKLVEKETSPAAKAARIKAAEKAEAEAAKGEATVTNIADAKKAPAKARTPRKTTAAKPATATPAAKARAPRKTAAAKTPAKAATTEAKPETPAKVTEPATEADPKK